MGYVRGDKALIEAEVDWQLRKGWDGDVETLIHRVAAALQADVEACRAVVHERIPAHTEKVGQPVAPGKLPASLLERAIASGVVEPSRPGDGTSGYRLRATPGSSSTSSLLPRRRPHGDNERLAEDIRLRDKEPIAAISEALGLFNRAPVDPEQRRVAGERKATGPTEEHPPDTNVPYRSELEQLFGESLAGIASRTGAASDLDVDSATAAATEDQVVFRSARPPVETVAHEVAHVLQHRRATATPSRVKSAPSDASEREASRVAAHVSRFGTSVPLPFQIREVPRAAVQFQRQDDVGSEAQQEDEPLPSEAAIVATLDRSISRTDARGLQARKRRLIELFQAIAPDHRAVVRRRLSQRKRDDRLARAFYGRIAAPTRRALLRVLEGEAVALPDATDPILGTAFVGPQNDIELQVSPEHVVIDPAWNPVQVVRVGPVGAFAPPEGESVSFRVSLTRRDDDGALEPADAATASWPVGEVAPPPAELTIRQPGTYTVKLELIAGGFVARTESRGLAVEGTEEHPMAERVGASTDVASAVHSMSDEQLIAQANAIAERLANEQPRGDIRGIEPDLSDDYKRLRDAQAALRFEAHRRGISDELGVQRDEPAELTSISLPGLDIGVAANDPAVCRQQLETLISDRGFEGTEDYLTPLLAYDLPAGVTEESSAIMAAKQAVQRQLGFLRNESYAFIEQFEAAGKQVGLGLLAQSRMHVQAAMAQYGIREEEVVARIPGFQGDGGGELKTGKMRADTSGAREDELADMLTHARRLVALHREVERSLNRIQDDVRDPATHDPSTVHSGDGHAAFNEHIQAFTAAREQALEKHPALEGFMTGRLEPNDAMKTLSNKSVAGAAAVVGGELVGHLADIEEAKAGLQSGELSVWKNPKLVELAKAHTGVVPGSMRDGIVAEKVRDENESGWTDALIAVVTIGAALVAAVLPGGQALAVELALVAVDLALIADEIDAYQLQKAAANTDFAQARKLAEGEPSLFPIVVSMVATGVGLGGVASAVGKVKRLRAAVRTAGSVDEPSVRALREELNALGSAHGKADLGDEVVESALRSSDDMARLSRMADSGVGGTTVAEQGTETLSRRLGVPVDVDESLGNGARVEYVVDPTTSHVTVTGLRVGPDALATVVMAHRKVIARMTRYNGVVGSLRSLWDRLRDAVTRRMRGTVRRNPFPPGTRGWESWEELAKIDELIAMRRARWQSAPDAKLIDDDIAYLEAERDFHRSVVDAIETDELAYQEGVGFVEAPKIGEVTAEAAEAGYHLPPKHGEHYYYKRVFSPDRTKVIRYELAIKPSAPKELDLPSVQPKLVNGVPVKGEFVPSTRKRVKQHIGPAEEIAEVVNRYLGPESTSSLKPYAAMLEEQKIAQPGEVEQVIAKLRRDKFSGVADVDNFRHAVKEHFREDMLKHLNDESLDDAASYARMREMTNTLNNKDKGNLTEAWYQGRHAPDSVAEVPIPDATAKDRAIDLVDGDTAIEVKSGAGKLSIKDKAQLESYKRMIREGTDISARGNAQTVNRLRYVFTDPAGAQKNLAVVEELLDTLEDRVTIDVFDEAGTKTTISELSDIPKWMRKP